MVSIKPYNEKAAAFTQACQECGVPSSTVYHLVKIAVWKDYWDAVEAKRKQDEYDEYASRWNIPI